MHGIVYLSYSTDLTTGWSTPEVIHTLPTFMNGYSYAFHAYSNYDPTGQVVPISWSEYSDTDSFHIAMANIHFS